MNLWIYFTTLMIAVIATIAISFWLGADLRFQQECESLNGIVIRNGIWGYACIKQTAVINI